MSKRAEKAKEPEPAAKAGAHPVPVEVLDEAASLRAQIEEGQKQIDDLEGKTEQIDASLLHEKRREAIRNFLVSHGARVERLQILEQLIEKDLEMAPDGTLRPAKAADIDVEFIAGKLRKEWPALFAVQPARVPSAARAAEDVYEVRRQQLAELR